MKIGYARVSTQDQNLTLQLDALKKADCEKIYQEKISGTRTDRPELTKLLEHARTGDVVVIWKLDRLGRSLHHLLNLVAELEAKGIGLKSLNDPVDTTTPQGRLVFRIFASLAEFERELIKERTTAGVAAAREKGKVLGRPKGLSEGAEKQLKIVKMLHANKVPATEIAQQLNLSRNTVKKYIDLGSTLS